MGYRDGFLIMVVHETLRIATADFTLGVSVRLSRGHQACMLVISFITFISIAKNTELFFFLLFFH